jgi:hypothetical protein
LVFHIFGALAEFEWEIIRELTNAGLYAARQRGRKGGRWTVLTPKQLQILRELYESKQTSVSDICKTLGLLDANTYVPTLLWIVLISGGVITVGFTYLFGLEKSWVHMLMVGALAVIIASALFTIYALEYPFAGEPRVTPDALELDLQRFEVSQK